MDINLQQVFNINRVNIQEPLEQHAVLNPLNLQNPQLRADLRRRRVPSYIRPEREPQSLRGVETTGLAFRDGSIVDTMRDSRMLPLGQSQLRSREPESVQAE